MLVRYLKNRSIAYDGIHTKYEKKGNEVEVKDIIAERLIKRGDVEKVGIFNKKEKNQKKNDSYDNKMYKKYENKVINKKRSKKIEK